MTLNFQSSCWGWNPRPCAFLAWAPFTQPQLQPINNHPQLFLTLWKVRFAQMTWEQRQRGNLWGWLNTCAHTHHTYTHKPRPGETKIAWLKQKKARQEMARAPKISWRSWDSNSDMWWRLPPPLQWALLRAGVRAHELAIQGPHSGMDAPL